ncbi:MAG TPA: YbaK/EbsC family protein [bacterium]|nr:YbaK/EbsC family protein [bacterium]
MTALDRAGTPGEQVRSDAVARVRAALAAAGVEARVVEFAESTRTARDAARAVGTSIGQIVKSLTFLADGRPVLVLASGANRVDTAKVARLAGAARVEKATADATREATGFSIGGVPPVGHRTALPVYVDAALLAYDVVYAAAGTPHAVFPIEPSALVRVTAGTVGDIAE